jgi:Zn-dependent M28 family amino/carboxypeptidase
MVNVDHAGVGNGKITVGLSKIEKAVAQAAGEKVAMSEKLELFGLFPGGDHVPFAEAGVPTATIVTSGPHPDFHQPTDTPDKINPELLAAVTRYTLALVWTLANEP